MQRACPTCGSLVLASTLRCPTCGYTWPELDFQTRASGWRRGLAIFGIVVAFPCLLTIPGWIALDSYRKWRDGVTNKPRFAWVMGVIGLVLIPLAVAGVVIGANRHTIPPEAVSASGPLSSSDESVLELFNAQIDVWIGAEVPLLTDYQDRSVSSTAWLESSEERIEVMKGVVARLGQGVQAIDDDGFRFTMQPFVDVLTKELAVVVELTEAVQAGDAEAEDLAVAHLGNVLEDRDAVVLRFLDRLRPYLTPEQLEELDLRIEQASQASTSL